MTQQDVLFLVMILIGLSSLTIIIVQFVRSRRRKPGDDSQSRGWWEGPWGDDRR